MGNTIGKQNEYFEEVPAICVLGYDITKNSTDKIIEWNDLPANVRDLPASKAFFGMDPVIRHYGLTLQFKILESVKGPLSVFFTSPDYYSRGILGKPLDLTKEEREQVGSLEYIGEFAASSETLYEHTFEVFLPTHLAAVKVCGFLLDSNDIVLVKTRAALLIDDAFNVNVMNATASVMERAARMELINKDLSQPPTNALARLRYHLEITSRMKKEKPQFIEASDGIRLAYRSYCPKQSNGECKAVIVELVCNGYTIDFLAEKVSKEYPIAYVIAELRGFGHSGGPRGYTPSTEQTMSDIKKMVRHFHMNFPTLPLYLAAASRVAGLLLNYASWKDRYEPDGYCFISPNFGFLARKTWNKEGMERLSNEVGCKVYRKNLLLSMLTDGWIKGSDKAVQLGVDEHVFRKDPLFVDSLSTNVMLSMNASRPEAQLRKIKVPVGLWISRKDQLLFVDKVVSLTSKMEPKRAEINVVDESEYHFEYFSWLHKYIGPWVMKKINSMAKKTVIDPNIRNTMDLAAFSNSLDKLQHPVFTEFIDTLQASCNLKLHDRPVRFFESIDGTELTYKEFRPSGNGRPIANLVLLWGGYEYPLPAILADKYNIAVYCLAMRGFGKSGGFLGKTKSKQILFRDLRSCVRLLRLNHPDIPLFLGGEGFHGAVILNYASWKSREPVNGYIFISPILLDSFVRKTVNNYVNMNALNQTISLNIGFYPFIAPELSIKGFNTPNGESIGSMVIRVNRSIVEAFLIPKPEVAFSCIDVPFGFWCGEKDELVAAKLLCDLVRNVTRISFKEIALLPNCNHVNITLKAVDDIAEFIQRHCHALAPSANVRIENASLKDFTDIEQIGKGAFGRVFLAKHTESGQFVALKVLRKRDLIENNEVHAVIQERNILRDLKSPFIVSFLGSFQDPINLYIIMEFIVGGELFTHLKYAGRFDSDETKFFAAELVLFFEYLFAQKYVYRDLKPENILLDSMGHIKMVDFGFAKRIVNRTNSFCGTPEYIAPEMIMKNDYDYSVDYWSLGIVIYEMLMGAPPNIGRTPKEVYRKTVYSKIDVPHSIDPDERDLLKKLLCQQPEDRLGSGERGIEEIKRHRWFKGVDWQRLQSKDFPPPYVPPSSYEGDTSNFLSFNSTISDPNDPQQEAIIEQIDQSLFVDF